MTGILEPPRHAQGYLGHLSFLAALRARRAFVASAMAELDAFLSGGERLSLAPRNGPPAISVVLVLYNQAHLTLRCLRGLSSQQDTSFETIIVDNASTDATSALLERVSGATIVRNPDNVGFLQAANDGAARARAPLLLLLNNDAIPMPDAFRRAAARLGEDDSIGALSGRIVFPHGRLQEAGPIVFANGFVIGYGMGAAPDRLRFRLPRETDFANGAFLATPRRLWAEHGGFDESFKPAYHEDTDYSFRLRAAGYRIVYDPAIRVVHLAHGSKTSIFAPFRQLARSRRRFLEVHARTLAKRIAPNWLNYARICLGIANRRWVLVIDGGDSDAVKRRVALLARVVGDAGGWASVISAADRSSSLAPPFWSQAADDAPPDRCGASAALLRAYFPFVRTIVAVGPGGRAWLRQMLGSLGAHARVPRIVLDTGGDTGMGAAEGLFASGDALAARQATIADAARTLA